MKRSCFVHQEVIGLVKQGKLKPDSQAGRSVGYRQALDFLQAVWSFPSSGEEDGADVKSKVSYIIVL